MKTPRLPKNMTNGQFEDLRLDFIRTFRGEEEITAEGIFNWLSTTGAVYEWFWPRIVHNRTILKNSGRGPLVGCLSSSCVSGFLNGIVNETNRKKDAVLPLSYSDLYDAAEMLWEHYETQLKEIGLSGPFV